MHQEEFTANEADELDDELFSGGGSPDKLFSNQTGGNRENEKKNNPQLNVSTQPTSSGVSSFENKNALADICTPLFVAKDTFGENGISH